MPCEVHKTRSMMAQSSQMGSTELSYNSVALPPQWQRGKTSLFANDPHTKKRKLEAFKTNAKKSKTNSTASQVNTHNRFAILEATEDAMDITEAVNTQHTQKTPPHPPIFIDDIIDIQTMTKNIEKEISKEEYKLKISNNGVKILPTNPDAYRKLTKLLKTQLPHLLAQARKTISCGAKQYRPLSRSR